MNVLIAEPHGFCSGVARAIRMAEALLGAAQGETIYCLNEIVHNEHVVADLVQKGMRFVGSVQEVPEGAQLLFSAHGVSPSVRQEASALHLRVIDATCPFVAKVHAEVRRFAAMHACVICIGHRRHEEVIGVAGEASQHVRVVETVAEVEALAIPEGVPIAVVTQTTLGEEQVSRIIEVLRRRCPHLICPDSTDICYATRDRQRAVRQIAKQCDAVVVLGSANSSNSQRLVETARTSGARALLISDLDQLRQYDFSGIRQLGITSGASTPESFLNAAVEWISRLAT